MNSKRPGIVDDGRPISVVIFLLALLVQEVGYNRACVCGEAARGFYLLPRLGVQSEVLR